MSKLFALALLLGAVCLLPAPVPSTAGAAPRPVAAGPPVDQSSATVKVKCDEGDSINKALSKHQDARSLVVEISGLCHENVVVTRDRVTLRGTDPASDGIDAVEDAESVDSAVWVRGAQLVTIENLKLTGGFSGLTATDANLPHLRLINCRLEGNSAYGMQLEGSLIEVADSVIGPNGNINAGIFMGSRFQCSNCTLKDPQGSGPLGTNRANVFVLNGSRIIFNNCTVTNGGINSDDALVLVLDSTLEGVAPNGQSLSAFGDSTVNLTRVQVTGQMSFGQSTSAQLNGVTQASGAFANGVNDNSFVRIGNASPATGGPPSIPSVVRGFNLNNFSNLSLFQTSQVSGNLNCSSGGNAFCAMPANVSGTSNCGLCPKP